LAMEQNDAQHGHAADPKETSKTTARSMAPTSGTVDRERVKAQIRRWQDRVLDLTKSNPLIGLNRSRVAKLPVVAPDPSSLFGTFVIDGSPLRMPLVRKRPRQPLQDAFVEVDADAELLVDSGDVTLYAKPADLMRRLRRIHDNARTTLEERGV